MGKKLLSRQDLEKCYYAGCRNIIIGKNFILPPGVIDLARNLGIRFIYVGTKEFSEMVDSLCAEYGVKDKAIVDEIVKRITSLFESGKEKKLELEG